jgi:hypothetical protein
VVKDGPVKVIGGMLVRRLLGRPMLGRLMLGRLMLGRLMLGRLMLGVAMLLSRELGREGLGRARLGRARLGRLTVCKLTLGRMEGVGKPVGTRVETKALGMMLRGTTTAVAVAIAGFVANMDCKTLTTAGKAGKGEKSVV